MYRKFFATVLTHITPAPFGVQRHTRSSNVGQSPAILTNRFSKEDIVVFQTQIGPVQRADRLRSITRSARCG